MEAAGNDAARIADELDQIAAIANEAPEQWDALIAPEVPTSVRKSTLDTLIADADTLTRNTCKVLVDNGRLEELPEVAVAFRTLVREREQQLDVHVTTAIDLSSDLRAKLEQRLSSSTGKQVQLHTSVDPNIIGGLVVRHGDTLVDTSLRGRLESLRLELSRPTQRPTSASSTDS
jgi:F-type H+-transporting ATPase subunit delta